MAGDSFEHIVRTLLEQDGYWVRQSFKVDLTRAEKASIGRPTMPRPEIDLLALDFKRNRVTLVEVKSYLDSPGVALVDVKQSHDTPQGRYKLFTCKKYEDVVIRSLRRMLELEGMANATTEFRLGLVFGRIASKDALPLALYARSRRWFFWSAKQVKRRLVAQSLRKYENDPAIISAKLLLR